MPRACYQCCLGSCTVSSRYLSGQPHFLYCGHSFYEKARRTYPSALAQTPLRAEFWNRRGCMQAMLSSHRAVGITRGDQIPATLQLSQ